MYTSDMELKYYCSAYGLAHSRKKISQTPSWEAVSTTSLLSEMQEPIATPNVGIPAKQFKKNNQPETSLKVRDEVNIYVHTGHIDMP